MYEAGEAVDERRDRRARTGEQPFHKRSLQHPADVIAGADACRDRSDDADEEETGAALLTVDLLPDVACPLDEDHRDDDGKEQEPLHKRVDLRRGGSVIALVVALVVVARLTERDGFVVHSGVPFSYVP